MSDERRPGCFAWVTWLTPILASDAQCLWKCWYKSHFKYAKREGPNAASLVMWRADHGDMVRARQAALEADGWTVYVEDQNKFFIRGQQSTLSGCPDLVAVRDEAAPRRVFALTGDLAVPLTAGLIRRARVEDCKTGKRRDSDRWQVLIYMLFLRETNEAIGDRPIEGAIVYHDRIDEIAPAEASAAAKARVVAEIRRASGLTAPPRTPSANECQFCDIAACPDRVTGAVTTVATEAF